MIGSWLALLLGTPVEAQEDYGRTGFYLGIAGSTGLYTKLDGQLGYAREQCLPALEDTDADGEFDVLNPCPPEIDENVGIDADASLGVHARAGYRFLPRLAVEAHLEYLAGSEIAADTFRWQTDITKLTALTLTADAKAYLSTGMVQPFALVGFGWMKTYGEDRRINPQVEFGQDQGNPTNPNTKIPMAEEIDTDDSGFVGRFGGGIDIYVTRNISIGAGASYVLPFGSWDTAYDYNYVSLDWGLQYRF
jgi:opacity protein-like surface antigen